MDHINTVFRGMNIHNYQLFWCSPGFRATRFWPMAKYVVSAMTSHHSLQVKLLSHKLTLGCLKHLGNYYMNYWGFAICSLGTADKNRNVRCHIDLVVIYSETIPPSFALKDLFASLDTLNRQSTDTQQFNRLRKALFSPRHHDAASAENVLRHAKCSIWSCTRRRWHRWSSRNC
jgi:hypothetical protein